MADGVGTGVQTVKTARPQRASDESQIDAEGEDLSSIDDTVLARGDSRQHTLRWH